MTQLSGIFLWLAILEHWLRHLNSSQMTIRLVCYIPQWWEDLVMVSKLSRRLYKASCGLEGVGRGQGVLPPTPSPSRSKRGGIYIFCFMCVCVLIFFLICLLRNHGSDSTTTPVCPSPFPQINWKFGAPPPFDPPSSRVPSLSLSYLC